jgi:membrane-bound ClpP family serine protease
MIKPDGTMESELWSAESAHEIEVGKKAQVIGMRSVVLLIDPLTQDAARPDS